MDYNGNRDIENVSDKYGKKTHPEIIMGGRFLKKIIPREDLRLVYLSSSIGDMTLEIGIKRKLYLENSFKTEIVIAPQESLFDLNKMEAFFNSLIEGTMKIIDQLRFMSLKNPEKAYIQCGEMSKTETLGTLEYTAKFLMKKLQKF